MSKIPFSDVTPPEKRSIRNIPIPNSGKRKTPIIIRPEKDLSAKPESEVNSAFVPSKNFESKMAEITEKKSSGAYEYYYPKNQKLPDQHFKEFGHSRKKQWLFGSAILICICVFIVGMMTIFSSATVDITPKSQEVAVEIETTGSIDAIEGTLGYEIVKLSKTKTASVAATGEEAVELKASGKIVIYNNFSSQPQRLITRTRFESPEGLIYRIAESVVVPGKTTKDGVETPGSIEVEVFADESGEKYNIGKTDFTIPGFKNDAARYKGFYARSSTAMTGGFVGKRKTVSSEDKQTALQNITTETEADLEKELGSKVPEGLVMLKGSVIYESKELQQEEDGSSVVLGEEVTAFAIMLNKQSLSNMITGKYISESPDWANIKPEILDFSSLNTAIDKPENLEDAGKINIKITGKATAWADIDTESIKQKLLGAPKKEAANLMDEFAGISSIKATIRPIWKQSFPKDEQKILVQTVTE